MIHITNAVVLTLEVLRNELIKFNTFTKFEAHHDFLKA